MINMRRTQLIIDEKRRSYRRTDRWEHVLDVIVHEYPELLRPVNGKITEQLW